MSLKATFHQGYFQATFTKKSLTNNTKKSPMSSSGMLIQSQALPLKFSPVPQNKRFHPKRTGSRIMCVSANPVAVAQGMPVASRLLQSGLFGVLSAAWSIPGNTANHLANALSSLNANPAFMSTLIAWALAQFLKIFTAYAVTKRLDWKMMFASGGLPSSHSALCMALTVAVAFIHGLQSSLFSVCLGFSLIVMYDATGVRYHAGMQAEVLNEIVGEMFQNHPLGERKLKELLGHTPLQVVAGAVLGTIVSIAYFGRLN